MPFIVVEMATMTADMTTAKEKTDLFGLLA